MKSKIIAFTGPMGSGKSEAIKILKAYVKDTPIVLIKFAEPLYDIQEYAYNRIASVYVRKPDFIKDRPFLQWLGTEWGRNTIGPDLWVELWSTAVQQAIKQNPDAIIVCDDCRFNNEAEIVKSIGGMVVKISTDKSSDRIDTSRASHISENGISFDFVDFIIENNDTLDHYKNQLTYLYNKLNLGG